MIKYYRVIVIFLLCSTFGYGQSYTLTTAEGKPAVIRLNADSANNELKVCSGRHCIRIKECTGLDQPEIVNDRLLKVTYSRRSGSGIEMRYTVLYGIRHKKLYEALHILSEYNREKTIADNDTAGNQQHSDEYSRYRVTLKFESKVANAEVYQEHYSKADLVDNYILIFNEVLVIDNEQGAYFTTCKEIKGDYVLSTRTSARNSNTSLNNSYPTITFRDREYYYIDHTWYEKGTQNELIACSRQEDN